jgi:hypothetical protein
MMKLNSSNSAPGQTAPFSAHASLMNSLYRQFALLAFGVAAGTTVQAQAVATAKVQPPSTPVAHVEPAASDEAASGPVSGEATKTWLGAQARREQASKQRQFLSGPVMSNVHKRYVDSFVKTTEPTNFRNNSDR